MVLFLLRLHWLLTGRKNIPTGVKSQWVLWAGLFVTLLPAHLILMGGLLNAFQQANIEKEEE